MRSRGEFSKKLCRWLRIHDNKRMSDFVTHCVKVIEGIWGGYHKFLMPVLFVSVCMEVMELSNQLYELKNAVNALEGDLSDDDESDDSGYDMVN